MTIKEIRAEKEKLEGDMKNLINEFVNKTGVMVDKISGVSYVRETIKHPWQSILLIKLKRI